METDGQPAVPRESEHLGNAAEIDHTTQTKHDMTDAGTWLTRKVHVLYCAEAGYTPPLQRCYLASPARDLPPAQAVKDMALA